MKKRSSLEVRMSFNGMRQKATMMTKANQPSAGRRWQPRFGRSLGRFKLTKLHPWLILLVALSLAVSLLPLSPAAVGYAAPATASNGAAASDDPPAPKVVTAPPWVDPHLPSLTLDLHLSTEAPDTITVGQSITATLSLKNSAPDPAKAVVITIATPNGAIALPGAGMVAPDQGWRWSQAELAANSSTTLTAQLKVTSLPAGGALLMRASVTAQGLPVALYGKAGVLVEGDNVGILPKEKANSYIPGAVTTLTSQDGQLEVKFGAKAYPEELTLKHLPRQIKLPDLKAQNKLVPPPAPPLRRGLGTFFLEAIDSKGGEVHKFNEPLTLTVKYTPQQLEALGLQEDSLTLYWFDESYSGKQADGTPFQGLWTAIPTQLDPKQKTVSAQVDHFSSFQLSDGSAPTVNFLPSLQGFQESLFTGGASYNYPIELPPGPGGLKPSLALSYSSSGMDGQGGMNLSRPAEWVGRGWSLDTGSVAVNRYGDEQVPYYSIVLNGQSFDVVGTPTGWRIASESFLRVEQIYISDRYGNSAWKQYRWKVWGKDGTIYEFNEDAWWAWDCNASATHWVEQEAYKWVLSKVTDVHGNTITYNYGRVNQPISSIRSGSSCVYYINGTPYSWNPTTVDRDIWPTSITWGGNPGTGATDRFKVEFNSGTRAYDIQGENAYGQYGADQKPQQLNGVTLYSKQASSWEVVSQYRFTYETNPANAVLSDGLSTLCPPSGYSYGPVTCLPKLTLRSVQRVGKDALPNLTGGTGLPATTFSYGIWVDTGEQGYPNGAFNRLTNINNGQGGTIALSYANIGLVSGVGAVEGGWTLRNYRRLSSKVVSDGRGNSYTTSYSYGTAATNSLGSNVYGWVGPNNYPNSAALWYNAGSQSHGGPGVSWLAHPGYSEFRGHAWVTVTQPDGSWQKHYFYQGDAGCIPQADDPNLNPPNVQPWFIVQDACWLAMRDREFLKGREWKTERYSSAATGNIKYGETENSFAVSLIDYGNLPASGLWRAFAYQSQTVERTYEGAATPLVKTTKYFYDPSLQVGGGQYGNLTRTEEYDQTNALYRQSIQQFSTKDDASSYIVDRVYAARVKDGQGRFLTDTHNFYDGNNTSLSAIGTKGELTRSLKFYNMPLVTDLSNIALQGTDSTFGYDVYGNRTTVTGYAGYGSGGRNTAGTWTYSAPGNGAGTGAVARTTTTTYDSTFHLYPITVTPPTVNGVTLTESATYDYRMGLIASVTDPNAQVTSAQYDVFGRMILLVKPGDTTAAPSMTAIYADWEQPYRYVYYQKDPTPGSLGSRFTSSYYDGLGRKLQSKMKTRYTGYNTVGQTIVSDTLYDNMSRAAKVSQPRYVDENVGNNPSWGPFFFYTPPSTDPNVMRWTTTSYDGLGRPLAVTPPDNQATTYWYAVGTGDLNGRVTSRVNTIDANHHRTQRRSDEFGQLLYVSEWAGDCDGSTYPCTAPFGTMWSVYSTTSYQYTPLSQLSKVIDTANNQTTLTYDSLGRKLTMQDPDMGSWAYGYDANGNLVQQLDAKKQPLFFGYDPLNRLTTKTGPSSSAPLVSFSDAFNTSGSGWYFNAPQTVPYNDSGNNVVKNVGTGSDWNASYVRSSYSLTSGKQVQYRFKLSSVTGGALAYFKLENNSTTNRYLGVVANNNRIYVQTTNDGATYTDSPDLITNAQANTWYVVQISLSDTAGLRLKSLPRVPPPFEGATPRR